MSICASIASASNYSRTTFGLQPEVHLMTAEEHERIQRFLSGYNRIDAHLRQKVGIPRHKGGFPQVTEKFDRDFPNMIDIGALRVVASIRNALVHETLSRGDYCVIPSRTIL